MAELGLVPVRAQNPVGNTLGKWMIPSCEIVMSFIFVMSFKMIAIY